jgi:hypothetical protein
LTYLLHNGSLSVTGTTANSNVVVTSTGQHVTVVDGTTSNIFTVTDNLSFNISMTATHPAFDYDPGAVAPGNVRLKVLSSAGLALSVNGTSNVNINGRLSITTGAGNDTVSVDNVNPEGLRIDTGAGQDTVLIGFNKAVTVRGNLRATDVNLFGLGVLDGPKVTVTGDVSVSTDVATGITFNLPNNIDVENNTTVNGDFSANLNGAFQLFSTMGKLKGDVDVYFTNGSDTALFQDGSSVGGNVYVNATRGASTLVDVGTATFGGNLDIDLGNGANTFVFHGTLKGHNLSYDGGSGSDNVTIASDSNLTDSRLRVNLGDGEKDVFTLDSNKIGRASITGEAGSTTLNLNVPITFPLRINLFGEGDEW